MPDNKDWLADDGQFYSNYSEWSGANNRFRQQEERNRLLKENGEIAKKQLEVEEQRNKLILQQNEELKRQEARNNFISDQQKQEEIEVLKQLAEIEAHKIEVLEKVQEMKRIQEEQEIEEDKQEIIKELREAIESNDKRIGSCKRVIKEYNKIKKVVNDKNLEEIRQILSDIKSDNEYTIKIFSVGTLNKEFILSLINNEIDEIQKVLKESIEEYYKSLSLYLIFTSDFTEEYLKSSIISEINNESKDHKRIYERLCKVEQEKIKGEERRQKEALKKTKRIEEYMKRKNKIESEFQKINEDISQVVLEANKVISIKKDQELKIKTKIENINKEYKEDIKKKEKYRRNKLNLIYFCTILLASSIMTCFSLGLIHPAITAIIEICLISFFVYIKTKNLQEFKEIKDIIEQNYKDEENKEKLELKEVQSVISELEEIISRVKTPLLMPLYEITDKEVEKEKLEKMKQIAELKNKINKLK